MPVDVFGRRREKTENTRGPPGIGFKLTQDGHYNIDHKRVCNLAPPIESADAVDFKTLKDLITSEVQSLYEVTKRLRSDIDDLNILLQTHKTEINSEIQKKVNDLTNLVQEHRNEIEIQLLDSKTKTYKYKKRK